MRGCLTVYSLLYVFKHIDSLAHQVHRRLPTTCADVTCLGCIAFAYYRECFPKAQTLVFEHLHKAIETPIIIHQAVADTSLVPIFGDLMLLLLDDHLPLGKIANDNSPLSQSVRDEMGGFVQTVTLLAALLLSNPLVDSREMEIPAGFLLAAVAFGAEFVELLVVPAIALESADVVEASLVVKACCQGLDAQVKGHDAVIAHGTSLPLFLLLAGLVPTILVVLSGIFIDERAAVVAACVPGYRYFMKMVGWCFSEMCDDVGITFGSPLSASTSRKHYGVSYDLVQVHGGIAEGKELMPWLDSGEPWFLFAFS